MATLLHVFNRDILYFNLNNCRSLPSKTQLQISQDQWKPMVNRVNKHGQTMSTRKARLRSLWSAAKGGYGERTCQWAVVSLKWVLLQWIMEKQYVTLSLDGILRLAKKSFNYTFEQIQYNFTNWNLHTVAKLLTFLFYLVSWIAAERYSVNYYLV